jgi:aryl-alcohol dehydrogenase-like predicted oxidoreductase
MLEIEQAIAVVSAAHDSGVTLIDTARVYASVGESVSSERLVGDALRQAGLSDRMRVATKGGHFRQGDRFIVDGRPETISRNCKESLRALRTERIAMYFLHKPDPDIPIVESVGTLETLRREGNVDQIGVSNVDGEQLAAARSIATIAAVQNYTDLLEPDPVIELCAQAGIPYLAYAPFNGHSRAAAILSSGTISDGANERGCVPQQLVLALLHTYLGVVPVVGARREATIRNSAAAAALALPDGEATSLVAAIRAELDA